MWKNSLDLSSVEPDEQNGVKKSQKVEILTKNPKRYNCPPPAHAN
jgi:hypothetical protein